MRRRRRNRGDRQDRRETSCSFSACLCGRCGFFCRRRRRGQPRGAGDRRRDDEGHVRVRDLSGRRAEDGRAHRRAGEARLLRRPARPSRAAGVPRAVGRSAVARSRRARPSGAAGRRRRAAQPIGVAEIRRKRLHTRGAVGVAHLGDPALADSQIYVTLADRPDLDGKYAVFGHVIAGDDVPARLERGDVIRKMYVKE